MPDVRNPAVAIVAVLAGAAIVRFQVWRALLCLAPSSLRTLTEDPPEGLRVPSALEPTWTALLALGFSPVGSHSEAPWLGGTTLFFDAALPNLHTWASIHAVEGRARVALLTQTKRGFVITTNFRRAARERAGRYLAGTIEGATPERLLKAHARRAAELGEPASQTWTLDGRVDLTRAWLAGPGAAELRLANAIGLLWTLGGLGLIASIFLAPQ